MGKFTKILLGLCLTLLCGAVWLGYQNKALRKDNERLERNQKTLFNELDAYNDLNGANIVSVQTLELSRQELKETCERMQEHIDELNIKLKRVEAVSQTNTNTTVNIVTNMRDSTIIRGDTIDHVKVLDWSDDWIDIHGMIDVDSVNLSVQSADTLFQVIHRVPKKFLFFKYGCKGINQDIKCSNPHTKIVYSRYINVK